MRELLRQAWSSNQGNWSQLLVLALLPLSWIFGGLVSLRRFLYQYGLYKQHTLPIPVIVVGNVIVGGVGKTPITIALVKHLTAKGWRVGVLTRGYGRNTIGTLAVTSTSRATDVGDEPLLIARHCQVPVFVDTSRVAAGKALLMQYPDMQVLICDDGLQHLELARDLELCVFDERGVGNGRLLPAGPLREPWPRKPLKSKTPCLVIRTSGKATSHEFTVQRKLANFAQQADGTQRLLSSWMGTPVQALAGIAKPEVFFSMLRAQGLTLQHTQALPDHAGLQKLQINPLNGDLLCTEKDAVKLWAFYPKAWAVPLQTTLPAELLNAIDEYLAIAQHAKLSSPHGHQTT